MAQASVTKERQEETCSTLIRPTPSAQGGSAGYAQGVGQEATTAATTVGDGSHGRRRVLEGADGRRPGRGDGWRPGRGDRRFRGHGWPARAGIGHGWPGQGQPPPLSATKRKSGIRKGIRCRERDRQGVIQKKLQTDVGSRGSLEPLNLGYIVKDLMYMCTSYHVHWIC
jgi:hypothetical protein